MRLTAITGLLVRDALYFRRLIFTRNRFVRPILAYPRQADASNDTRH